MSSEKRFAMELPEDFDLIAGRGWLQKAAEKGHRGAEEFLQSLELYSFLRQGRTALLYPSSALLGA